MKEIYYGITPVQKKHHYTFLKKKDVTKESPRSTKLKYILLTHSHEEFIVGIKLSHVDHKTVTMMNHSTLMKINITSLHHTLHFCNH